MAVTITGGTVVTTAGSFAADLRIEGERIVAVGQGVRSPGDTLLDATSCFVLPGGIDPHTHMQMPAGDQFNADTWYTGTTAAAWGGTTTVIDMITQERGSSLRSSLQDWQERARPQAVIDFGFHMGITDPRPAVLAEIPAIMRAGVPSFKLYMAYRHLMLTDGQLLATMRVLGQENALALIHAENGDLIETLIAEALAQGHVSPRYHAITRPPATEVEATARVCRIADMAGCRLYIVHVSCADALAEVLAARGRGQPVLAETCTHYLIFTAADMEQPGFDGARFVLSPALRSHEDRERLWRALGSDQITVLASDHCPWTSSQRKRGTGQFNLIPGGIPGVEERLPFLYTYGVEAGLLSIEQLVALTATNPAQIFDLYPTKGVLMPGADADIVVWDPTVGRLWSAASHHSGTDETPYEGLPVHGGVRHVLVRGRPVIQDGTAQAEPGFGRFLPRNRRPQSN
ncbi:MAG: dihydropyrimidinase [Mycobacterium leprae]